VRFSRGVEAAAGSLLSIQVLRAIAALAVTVDHMSREFGLKLHAAAPIPPSVAAYGGAGVDLFFVISGFIMVYASDRLFGQRGGPAHFAMRRCVRIIPLYWAASVILLAFVLRRYPDLASADLSPSSIAASFLFIPWAKPDGTIQPLHAVGWTLNYEMFFYLVFSVALLAPRRAAVFAVTGFFAVLVALGQLLAPLPVPLAYWSDPVICEFAYGLWIAVLYREGVRLPRWASAPLVLAGIATATILSFVMPGPRCVQFGIPAALVVAGLVLVDRPRRASRAWRALGLLGDASYALYLLHPFAMTLPRPLYPYLSGLPGAAWLYALALLISAVTVAVLAHLLFEKPLTRRLQPLGSAVFPPPQNRVAVAAGRQSGAQALP
jgi:peptidoglycan/LPS O-acetylase OafA/YrhL